MLSSVRKPRTARSEVGSLRTVLGSGAFVWAELFAVVHVYWAAGGTWALPSGVRVPRIPALLAIDIAAVPLCAVGGLAALSLIRPLRGPGSPRARRLAVAATGLICLAHSTPTVVAATAALAQGHAGSLSERTRISYFCYEPYWFLGGLLTAALYLADSRRVARDPRPSS
ncbi:MAG: hypothetical protein QG608_247 [Actinomycetota bacterium]|nr:hypothetical protein [Actinomycetota bacterium]